MRLTWTILLACAALTGCAAQARRPQAASATPAKPPQVIAVPRDPFPSTYRAQPARPTLIRGATIYDGAGHRLSGAVLLRDGKVAAIGPDVAAPEGATIVEAAGLFVTPGVIDIHSHLGDYPTPAVEANSDGNEITGPVRSEVWALHSVWPQDPGFTRALMNGGVTSLHVLPGSANLFGGRGVTLKNVAGETAQSMRFPDAPYSLKMACGENPKRVYGSRGGPGSRMGNVAVMRQTWSRAVEYKRRWDDYTARAKDGKAKPTDAPVRDLQLDTLVGVLGGEILVQNHCYRADEMANIIDMSHEFGYHVSAFHHATESYKIADLLKREGICSAMWADWYGFKMESFDGIQENIAFVHAAGACAVVHSDDAIGIQRLNQAAAKAMAAGNRVGLGITPEIAVGWFTLNPARALGIADRVGSLEPGKMGDVVLWNGDPFSVYSRPQMVWIDGALVYDMNNARLRPVSDFELGQPGEGDAK